MSRIGKNARGVSGLVKKSARLAVLLTNGMVMSCASTRVHARRNAACQCVSTADGVQDYTQDRWPIY
eukprot:2497973-Pleurochrysis_carterae.AAC.1